MNDARQQLIEYIGSDAVFHGDFTLTSGKKASYYVDLRRVSLDHRVAPLIGQVMLDLIAPIERVDAVGGLTMGADPIASAILHQGAARGLAYDAFVVRALLDDASRLHHEDRVGVADRRAGRARRAAAPSGRLLRALHDAVPRGERGADRCDLARGPAR
ncbi:hypothetical protein NB037_12215, partial [Rathayibacter sp. ZW T2_19]|nr:hypothetical protein [Rathayibacter rubneri]